MIGRSRIGAAKLKFISACAFFCTAFMAAPAVYAQQQFVPVTPCRVVDTRNPPGPFGGPELAGGDSVEFDIPLSDCNIPSEAVAYSLNVTVVPDGLLSYLTIWPSGQDQPTVSTLNSDGRFKANAAITPAGVNGGVSVYVTDATQVILDIDGYFVASSLNEGLAFYPVTPCRLVDTRNAEGPLGGPSLGGGTYRDFPILDSNCGLDINAVAYSLNVTAIPYNTLAFLTMWPSDEDQPLVSTLNAGTGVVTANGALVLGAESNGDINVYVSDDSDVVIDVNGYFENPDQYGLSFYPVNPCRVLDTRDSDGGGAFYNAIVVDVQDSSTNCAPSPDADVYVFNATVVPSGLLSYLTLWPDTEDQPLVSTLNAADGAITSNLAIVPTDNGSIDAYATDSTQLILDVSGYFAP